MVNHRGLLNWGHMLCFDNCLKETFVAHLMSNDLHHCSYCFRPFLVLQSLLHFWNLTSMQDVVAQWFGNGQRSLKRDFVAILWNCIFEHILLHHIGKLSSIDKFWLMFFILFHLIDRQIFPCYRGSYSTVHGQPSRPQLSTCPSTSTSY